MEKEGPFAVYFGDSSELYGKGKMSHLGSVVVKDRFSFQDTMNIEFYVNSDEECKKERQFESDEPAIALYAHPEMVPFTLEGDQDDMSFTFVSNWLSVSLTEAFALWSTRSSELVFESRYSVIFYLVPDQNEISENDWIATQLFPGI